ncbi:response regulator GltR [Psychromonas ingrahamii 37]|uniref:Response regulator GltR n=1 Tax=Psychromonas ingrahamii (strain DSM 17664 / CCUG 51855 / 37) TaxID=357804 RepID=A1SX12_PSYIN|nr:response regulator transcription factor [Psychromonas ingrahamii]ABM04027.1 response regulator GltR [Psychromonas ingrahamii 37]
MTNNKQVLVIDDDQAIRELLAEYLSKNNFDVITAEDGLEMDKQRLIHQPDLIILDIMLPGDDGFILCQRIRQTSHVPIIMLTANSDEMDRVLGLEIGADDYIAKPFSPRELLARIKALLRRTQFASEENQPSAKARYLLFSNWKLDTKQHLLIDDNKDEISLTGADFQLLTLFLDNTNSAISRDQICQALHGRDAFANERGIDVHVSRLRQCLKDDAKSPKIIKTIRGAGYVFIADVNEKN